MSSENWDVRFIGSQCQRGARAGMPPPLSFPKLILFLLKLDVSQLFLSCPYVRAISMTLVPKIHGNRKSWLTNKIRSGYTVLEGWGPRSGRVTTGRLPGLYFPGGKSPSLTARSHDVVIVKIKGGQLRESTVHCRGYTMKKLWTSLSVRGTETIRIPYRFLVLQLTFGSSYYSPIVEIPTKFSNHNF